MSFSSGKPAQDELHRIAGGIRLLVLDVDGVLTDGGLHYGPQGQALQRFDVKDGHALVLAREAGLPTALLSARVSPAVELRAQELKLVAALQGQRYKLPALEQLLQDFAVPPAACAYMGDDLNDLLPMGHVGLSACPADAAAEVRQRAAFVSRASGGHGAVRELVELCLKASGRWENAVAQAQQRGPAEFTG